ncbi:MAG: SpoIIE family protein phosphatase [Vicinamibacteria bacterium]
MVAPELVLKSADGEHRIKVDLPRMTLGRSRDADIFIPDQWLSRMHAEIRFDRGALTVADLGSKNGTLVNGSRIQGPTSLRTGDQIKLGDHTVTVNWSGIDEEPEDDIQAIGTKVFSVRTLQEGVLKAPSSAQDLVRKNRVLTVLSGAAAALLAHRPLSETFDKILDILFGAVPAERGAIALFEGPAGAEVPEVKASKTRRGEPILRVSRTISRRVLKEKVSILLPNVLEDAMLKSEASIVTTGIRSAMCAPLWHSDEGIDSVIGVVYLDSRERTHTFSEEDLELVTALASVAAAKIENARLLEESLEKRRLEEDMRVAAEIQRSMLPKACPTILGYDIAAGTEPCRAVGGDYFDFHLTKERLTFALGDVSGKGTGAALIMTILRAAVRDHWLGEDLIGSVSEMNNIVTQNVPANKYVTFFIGRLDIATGRLDYINAGHNPPILSKGSGVVDRLTTGGMVLGLFEDALYESGSTMLDPQDRLVVFTDGFSETWNSKGDELGEEGLVTFALDVKGTSATAMKEHLLRKADEFAEGLKATDDRTIIVVCRNAA